MKKLKIQPDWLQEAFPQGLPVPSSTVLTGPLGAGKPIIAQALVSSWLEEGGGLIAAPLQFPDRRFLSKNLKELYGLDLKDYKQRLVYVQFDPTIDSIDEINQHQLKANLVKPANWNTVINKARKMIPNNELGLMFLSTALNLPLFSPTYSDSLMDKIHQLFTKNESITHVTCVSTSMLEEKIEKVAEMADNLIKAYISKEPKRLRFRVKRTKNAEFLEDELEAPFSQEMLKGAKRRAEKFRVTPVGKIKMI